MQLILKKLVVFINVREKMTDKVRKYKREILVKKRTNLVSRIIRKFSEIDVLLYSHQNEVTVKEQLAQLSDIFKLIEDINQEIIELDDNYTEELWFTDIVYQDKKVFSFKHKIHYWLREGDEMQRIEKKSRSSCSRSISFKSSSRSTSSKSSTLSTKETAIEEKVRLADLQAAASFRRRKNMQSCKLNHYRLKKKSSKAQARVKIYEGEDIDQKVSLKTLTMVDIKAYDSRYPVITKKQKYLDKNQKLSAATQFQSSQGSTDFQQPTISKGSYRISSIICKTNRVVLQQIKMKSQTVTDLVSIMRLVSCCINWSKRNQYLV